MTRLRWTFLAFALVACGDDSSESPADTDDSAARPDARVTPPRLDATVPIATVDAGARDSATVQDAAPAADAGPKLRIAEVYDAVFNNSGSCSFCHPIFDAAIDFSSADTAYTTLVEKPTVTCGQKPLVTPGDPSKSYLVDIVSLDAPCPSKPEVGRMPNFLPPLDATQIDLIKRWIGDGALK